MTQPLTVVESSGMGPDAGTPMQDQLELVAPLVDAVWTRIAAEGEGKSHVRVLFTSPEHEAGTTLIAAATAMALARNLRANVLFVETHMRRPSAASYFGTDASPGFSDLLLGHTDVESVVRDVPGTPDLHVLPGGSPRPAITGEFALPNARKEIGALMERARFVIFDAPPLTTSHEARGLLTYADASVLVLRSRSTLKREIVALAELVEAARVPIIGTVLNRHVSDLGFLSGPLGAS